MISQWFKFQSVEDELLIELVDDDIEKIDGLIEIMCGYGYEYVGEDEIC